MTDDEDITPASAYGTIADDLTSSHGDAPPWGWDYVLVFPAPEAATSEQDSSPDPALTAINDVRISTLSALRTASFSYSQLWLPADGLVLVRLSLPESALFEKAAADGLRLRLLPRYGAGYLVFDSDRPYVFDYAFRTDQGLPYFPPAVRVQLTLATLRSRDDWGAAINLGTLRRSGVLKQAFALHAHPEREQLLESAVYKQWWNPRLIIPLHDLKEYFGSRVAIYLAWLAFYARMLLGIAVTSIPVYIVLRMTDAPRVEAWTRLLWGLSLCIWGTYWLEYWKRRNAVLNVKWGLDRFYEDNENDIRPDFKGEDTQGFYCRGGFVNLEDLDPENAAAESFERADEPGMRDRIHARLLQAAGVSDRQDEEDQDDVIRIGGGDDVDFVLEAPITGLTFPDLPVFPYSSKGKLKDRIQISGLVTLFFALLVAACSFLILFFKTEIVDFFGADRFGKFVPGIATALLISISDPLWKGVSLKLTKWENHRTIQSYEDSLITKRFAFQFVSSKCCSSPTSLSNQACICFRIACPDLTDH